jgi:hypothetical protein
LLKGLRQIATAHNLLIRRYSRRASVGGIVRTQKQDEQLNAERRGGSRADRRAKLWWSLLYGGMNPRRRDARRTNDHDRPIVDWHAPELLASAILVLILCVADAFLTLKLLTGGAIEANPIMALLVYGDAQHFAIAKLAMTGVGVLALVAVARFRVFRYIRVAMIVHAILLTYIVLISYELLLLARVA